MCLTPERSVCLDWFAALTVTLEPWTVPITVSSHSTYDTICTNEDKSLQRQCQGRAEKGCEEVDYVTLYSIRSVSPISADLMFFHQFPSSSLSHPGQWQSSSADGVEYGGWSSWRTEAAGHKRALGLITPLLGGSARSCLNRPQSAGD